MIFVTVGTNEAPFDRLVDAAGRLRRGEEVIVQHGSSLRPIGATLVEFLPFDELVRYVRRARIVVTHAGVGSILVALTNGSRPIVMPRRRAFGEAVDDHQADFAERVARAGLVTIVEAADELAAAIENAHGHGIALAPPGGPLADELRSFLAASIDDR